VKFCEVYNIYYNGADKMRILILCTGNSCRSQMAEGFLKHWYPDWEVYSAGTNPSAEIHPKAIKVMMELDIDISKSYPKDVDIYKMQSFDYVITVCNNAKENCPVFVGKVEKNVHIGFEDPAEASGSEEEIWRAFRKIRDEIYLQFDEFFKNAIR
jgi:arsenate reductase